MTEASIASEQKKKKAAKKKKKFKACKLRPFPLHHPLAAL